jgi:cystathionine beta-synthase
MKDHGFLETRSFVSTARDIIRGRNGKDSLCTVTNQAKVSEAISVMNREGIDQIPVTENEHFVGSISSSGLLEKIMEDPQLKNKTVGEVMDKPMQFVAPDSTLDVLSSFLNKESKAVLVRDESQQVHIITRHDVLKAITN